MVLRELAGYQLSELFDEDQIKLQTELLDSSRINRVTFLLTHIAFDESKLNPVLHTANVFDELKVSLQFGHRDAWNVEVKLSQSKVVAREVTLDIDCTKNGDLVDFFKTVLQGHLLVQVPYLSAFAQISLSQLLRQRRNFTQIACKGRLMAAGTSIGSLTLIASN